MSFWKAGMNIFVIISKENKKEKKNQSILYSIKPGNGKESESRSHKPKP